jgi:hypothetical protein
MGRDLEEECGFAGRLGISSALQIWPELEAPSTLRDRLTAFR